MESSSSASVASVASLVLVARPSRSLGPYYPPSPSGLPFHPAVRWSEVAEHDLARRNGLRARGPSLDVRVLVVDAKGAPAPGATVELWSVNADARYVCEPGASGEDPGFIGFGRARSGSDGSASFRTVWPVAYSRYVFLRRPPHLHFRVQSRTRDDAYEVEVPPFTPDREGAVVDVTLAP